MSRPPLYNNPEDLQIKIDEYFSKGYTTRKVLSKDGKISIDVPIITITGLVRYCGFESRQSFYAYEDKPEFSYTIKSARNKIEEVYEGLLQSGLGAGAIFALKNFGWVDEQKIAHSGGITLSMGEVTRDNKRIDFDIGNSEVAGDIRHTGQAITNNN